MSRRYRFLLRPGWIALTLLAVALIVTMVLLGRWQMIVSDEKHFNIRNFGYALQWWTFSLFVVWFWTRLVRDHLRGASGATSAEAAPPAPPPVTYRRYVMPTVAPADDDPEVAAYNDYLGRLAQSVQKDANDE